MMFKINWEVASDWTAKVRSEERDAAKAFKQGENHEQRSRGGKYKTHSERVT